MRKGILGFVALLISLLVISGCGDDDSSLSQEEFEQQLELVCNEGGRERAELVSSLNRELQEQQGGKLTGKFQEESIRKLATTYQGTIEEIKELGLPPENPEQVEELVKAQEEVSARVLASPLAARDSLSVLFEDADKKAEALGVQSCTL